MREPYDFCLKLDFDKTTAQPEKVFENLAATIRSLQSLDQVLVKCVAGEVKTVLLLEDVEPGSIVVWLRQKVEDLPDELLRDGELNKIIGHFLVKGKASILRYLDSKNAITTREEIKQIETAIVANAQESKINQMDCYSPPNTADLIAGIQQLSTALRGMRENDKLTYIDDEGNTLSINKDFKIADDVAQSLIVREELTVSGEMILMVKQPDYLGDAQWKFRHGKRMIDAKISDIDWLKSFRARKIDLRPGDSIKAIVKTTAFYGYNNELISEKHEVVKITEVVAGIPASEQMVLDI